MYVFISFLLNLDQEVASKMKNLRAQYSKEKSKGTIRKSGSGTTESSAQASKWKLLLLFLLLFTIF